MPRTLPWLNQGRAQTARVNTPNRRPRRATQLLSDNESTQVALSGGRQVVRRPHLNERTPSTSPPPAPPLEDFMHEGYDKDDAYIMVEDEFLAVAKSFTQHLHHAEYVRLKELAKSQNASTIHTISRPVDTRTTMRRETAKRSEAKQRANKQADTLHRLGAQHNAGSEEELSDLDEDKEDDPWFGTSLHSLMASPRKVKTSLSQLAKLKSGSRAAAGFAKPGATNRRVYKSASPSVKQPEDPSSTIPLEEEETASETEDDDLNGPTISKAYSQREQLPPPTQMRRTVPSSFPVQEPPSSPPVKVEAVDSQFSIRYPGRPSPSRRQTRSNYSRGPGSFVKGTSLSLVSSSDDEEAFFKREPEIPFSKMFNRRESKHEKNSNELKKPSTSVIDIPTFAV